MTAFIIRRLSQGLIVIIMVTLLIFFGMRALPGDPLVMYLAQNQNVENMTPERLQDLRHQFGLDKPVIVQYVNWLGNLFHGKMGTSIFYREDVGKLLVKRIPVTMYLGFLAILVTIIVGAPLGIIAAIKRGTKTDALVTFLSNLGVTIPVFWLGILMIFVFGLKLNWLPIAGYTSPLVDFTMSIKQIIMPVICECIFGVASISRQIRSCMLEVIQQDYIRTAWAKGLRQSVIITQHALKNSLIPVVTMLGIQVSMIFGGSVLVETVFAIPGIGRLLATSIFGHDYVVVQGVTLVIAIVVLLSNLIVDISYGWLDPRIRYQ
jgi:peptide/nickel transport system permease protein